MTSLHHHGHLHTNATSSIGGVGTNQTSTSTTANAQATTTINSLNTSLNNSTNTLSPVIQRKIETQQSHHYNHHHNHHHNHNHNQQQQHLGANRNSIGSNNTSGNLGASVAGVGVVVGGGGGVDFDTTSIASISESSHWSGGGGDDLDNVALMNGSDINIMENKDWSTYLRMSKNGYNSSDDDDQENDDDDEEEEEDDDDDDELEIKVNNNNSSNNNNDEDSDDNSLTDDKTISAKMPSKNNKTNNKKMNNNNNNNNVKKSISSLNSSKSSLNKKKLNNSHNLNKSNKHVNNNSSNGNSGKINNSNRINEIKSQNKQLKTQQTLTNSSNLDEIKTNNDNSLNNDIEIVAKSKIYNSNLEDANNTDRQPQQQNAHTQRAYEYDDDVLDDEEEADDDDDLDDDDDDDDDDDLDDDDIWTIKPKLYSYYEKQFKTMQPNINGYITGAVAKTFFERSKLPLTELSKIWELSDVTKDGALSFAEFCTAMHLVVLRVRNFDLPNELPPKLQPYAPLIDFNSDTNLNAKTTTTIATSSDNNVYKINNDESMLNLSDSEDLTISSPTQSSSKFMSNNGEAKPLVFGVKPQMQADIQLAHPVALRYPQQYQQQVYNNNNNNSTIPEPPPRHSRSNSLGAIAQPDALPSSSQTNNTNKSNNAYNQTTPNVTTNQMTSSLTSSIGSGATSIINTPSVPSSVLNTPKILQQQPPVVPPRITSPPPSYLQQQQQHTHHIENTQSAGLLPPPPPPPLSHHHIQHYHNQNRVAHAMQHHHQNTHHHQQLVHQYSLPHSVQSAASNIGSGSMTAFRAAPLPPVPTQHQTHSLPLTLANTSNSVAQSPDDSLKTIEKLVEHMSMLNMERLKKLGELRGAMQHQQTSTSQRGDVDLLNESIRVQSEQNQVLRKVFSELEKELRSLTDTRIELEIKLDYLNSASTASCLNTPQQAAQMNPSSTSTVKKVGHTAKSNLNAIPATPIVATSNPSSSQSNSTVINNTPQMPNSSSNSSNVNSAQQTPSILNGSAQLNQTPSVSSSNTSKIII